MRAAGRCGAARTQAPAYARYLITVAYRFNNEGFSLFFSSAVCVVIFNNNEHPPPYSVSRLSVEAFMGSVRLR